MAKFSAASLEKLSTCDPQLQRLAMRAIQIVDCTILDGRRSKTAQDAAFERGSSKARWPESKHNCPIIDPTKPRAEWLEDPYGKSRAMDIAAYPVDWKKRDRFVLFAGFMLGLAAEMGVKIRVGVDWNQNFDTSDESFFDGPHVELID